MARRWFDKEDENVTWPKDGTTDQHQINRQRGYVLPDPNDPMAKYHEGERNQQAPSEWSPDGMGYEVKDGFRQLGTSAYDKDVNRAQQMAQDSYGRQAVQLDQGAANQARGVQMGALWQLRRGAVGGMPSRAVELGRMGNADAFRGTMQAAGGARGAGQAVARMRAAQQAGASAFANNAGNVGDMRAREISQDQNALVRGGLGMRGSDIDAAGTDAKLEAEQRRLNEARAQNFERQAFDTRKQQLQAAVDAKRLADEKAASERNAYLRERALNQAQQDQAVATGVGMMQTVAMAGSDSRLKRNAHPLGSLASLHKYFR